MSAAGIHAHPTLKLGLRRTPDSFRRLRLGDYLTGVVPAHPTAVDHFTKAGLSFGLYQNDTYGDCGPTSVANLRRLVTAWLTGTMVAPTQADVFDLYRRSGNPNFDPTTGADDNGVDMGTMLTAVASGGIAGVKALAFAQVDHTNRAELDAASSLFGGILWGVDLQTAQQTQTNTGTWTYSPSSEWGGHAILNGKYTEGTGELEDVITWATDIKVTDSFLQHQLQEAWVVVWPENVTHPAFQAGVDLTALAADWQSLTGQPASWTTGPTPTPPGPAPDTNPADVAFAAVLHPWIASPHTSIQGNAKTVAAAKVWLAAKGL